MAYPSSPARERIGELLAGISGRGGFTARRIATADGLEVTEKSAAMDGTLVVTLPSAFKAGDFR